MKETIAVALIGMIGSLLGSLGGIVASSRLTNYRIEQLEKRVNEHNSLISRTYDLEAKDKVFEEKLNSLGNKVETIQNRFIS